MTPLICIVRPGSAAMIVPKAGDRKSSAGGGTGPPGAYEGLVQRTKLKGLVASALKSNVSRSLTLKLLPIVRASCLVQNPRTQLSVGARLPKLKPVEVVNAAAFRKRSLAGSKSRGFVTL